MSGALVVVLLFATIRSLPAQLRPYEPFDWSLFDGNIRFAASAGSSVLWHQRASLAGTEGRLAEFGNLAVGYRVDRVALELGGTVYRDFRERSAFATATGGAEERPLGRRTDVGDYRIATGIRLTQPDRSFALLLRFGSRLPTTDNTVGLERDATDFFATIATRTDYRAIRLVAEFGLGIHGTRRDDFEQSDLFIYMLGLSSRTWPINASLFILGQADGTQWAFRGTEPLSELRLRLQSPGRLWVRTEVIMGLTDFSPARGVSISVGGTF